MFIPEWAIKRPTIKSALRIERFAWQDTEIGIAKNKNTEIGIHERVIYREQHKTVHLRLRALLCHLPVQGQKDRREKIYGPDEGGLRPILSWILCIGITANN